MAMVRRNRLVGAIDRVAAWNGKMTYECTWTHWDHGDGWLCFWGMRIYDWENLGDPTIHGRRGCSGVYLLKNKPHNAAVAKVRVTAESTDTCLDPFEHIT